MNNKIISLIISFCFIVNSIRAEVKTDSSKIHFENAFQEVKEMLEETKALDFQRAVFITENAYHDNVYSYEAFQQTIENNLYLITQLINANNKSDTFDFNVKVKQNGRFNIDEIRYTPEQKRELYNKVLTNWAIFTYITDTTAFGNYIHYPYQYNANDPFGMKKWKNSQVINLLSSNKNTGNCFAFAALFKIFANQLNSDAVICTAPQHIYIQHKDHKGDWYNVELATAGHPTDGSIQTLTYTTNKALMNDIALRNLDEKQSVALCLVNLAKSYEHKYNNPTADFLLQCAELALKHDSKNLNALLLKQQVLDARVVVYARTNKINTIEKLRNDKEINGQLTQLEKHLTHLSQLGYIQMPLDMQEIVMNGFKGEHTAQFIKKDKNPSPFTSIDVPDEQNQYVDVSHGLFQEVFAPKAIEIYGHFTFNTQQGKITELDTSTINHQLIDPVAFAYDFGARIYDARLGRFLSTDAFESKYPHYSPYSYAGNSPIINIDIGGDSIWVTSRTVMDGKKMIITRTIHTTIALLNISEDPHNMGLIKKSLHRKLTNALTKNKTVSSDLIEINYKTDVRINVVSDMSEVKSSDHLIAVVDEVDYGESIFSSSNTTGVALMFGKISYVETTSGSRSIKDMVKDIVHEWGHNAGLGHEFGDKWNYMSYSKTKYEFSNSQLHQIFADGLSGKLNKGENSSTVSSSSWFSNSTSTNEDSYRGKVSKGDKIPKVID